MKNQDIFEVFKHLKTLLGGISAPVSQKAGDEKSESETARALSRGEETEKRLRDFHLKHEALSRKILRGETESLPSTRLFCTPKKENGQKETPSRVLGANPAHFPLEKETPSALPLFPPSLP